MDEIIIEKNQFQKVMVFLMLGFMVIVSGGILIFAKSIFGPLIITKLIGLIIFIGSLLIFKFVNKKMAELKDMLIINSEGIKDDFSTLSIGLVKWEEIESAYITRVATEEYICIKLKDIEDTLKRLPTFKKNIINYNISKTNAHICINCNSRAHSNKEILDIINNRIKLSMFK